MLVLNPQEVMFGAQPWADVTKVVVDRRGVRVAGEWSDLGPHEAFVDVPERRTVIRVSRRVGATELASPALGESAELSFYASANASHAGRRRVRATAVVTDVSYTVAAGAGSGEQVVTLIALSATGAADPIVVEPAETN